mmetsp:Transcript_7303/g.989  ORF Transcript_7303/g.989 Transcript_7303/m.989 type:complete len:83 (+) Transcript_7303:68-316(+)
MWVVICVFNEGKSFDGIEDTYCRFLCGDVEFSRYDMSCIKDGERNACFMCDMYKMGSKWTIKGRGYFAKGVNTTELAIPVLN